MAINHNSAQLLPNALLQTLEQLSDAQLEQLIAQAASLRAQRNAPYLAQTEEELLHRINDDLPDEFYTRYEDLLYKRDEDTLTPSEYDEFISMNDTVELHHAERLKCVGELAIIHNTTFAAMMQSLDIQPRHRRNE